MPHPTSSNRAQSLVPPGTPDGSFRLLYRFDDEQLSELRNATVHAFASLSIRQTPGGYLAPFRRLIVYPAIIRNVQRTWAQHQLANALRVRAHR